MPIPQEVYQTQFKMSQNQNPHPLIRAQAIKQLQEHSFSHPWNNNSEIKGTFLGQAVGLQRIGINLVHIPPGKESFIYHSHQLEKEFEVGAGDFMGFPTPKHIIFATLLCQT